MKHLICAGVLVVGVMLASLSWSYPLDGYAYTGITRLEAYRLAMEGKVRAPKQPPGALLISGQVDLRMMEQTDFKIPASDPEFTARVQELLGAEADRYAVAVLDLTSLEEPRYAEHQASVRANPGSIGKIMIALGLFQAVAGIYPDDTAAR